MTFIERLKKSAKDNAHDAWLLSSAYEDGYLVYGKRKIVLRKNKRQAFRWVLHAAQLGSTGAMASLGYYLATGQGCKKNVREAIRWEKKAYSMGYESVAFNLGCSYRQLHQYSSAYQWFKKAYVHDKDAAFDIGNCYLLGQGVKKSSAIALRYFREVLTNTDLACFLTKICSMKRIAEIRCNRSPVKIPPLTNLLRLRYMTSSVIEKLAKCYKDELRRTPKNEAAHYCLAQLYFYHRRYQEALPHLRQCEQLSFYGDEDEVIAWLAVTYYRLGMLKEEIELYQSYLKVNPKNQWATRRLKSALKDLTP